MSNAVVAGFDGSDQSRRATLWAAGEASSRRCPLEIVDVVHGPFPELLVTPVSAPLPVLVPEEVVRAVARDELADLLLDCRRAYPDLEVRTHLLDGHPVPVLKEFGGDLVVLGSSGRTGLAGALLGSVTSDLVHHLEIPVVVARSGGGGPVVVGVDGSAHSASAIDFAFSYADRHSCDLIALHSGTDAPVEAMAWDYDRAQLPTHAETVVGQAIAGHRSRYPDVRVEPVVSFDRPAAALLSQAKDATLLVVGSHGKGVLRRALLGSVSHAVLYHAPCSVAVVRG